MSLEREHAAYEKARPDLVREGKKGKFVLIHGDELAGTYDTWEAAAQAGYDRFGLERFLVKQVAEVEKVRYFSRNITPCPDPK